ncbi:MAG TPA: 6-phosphofructokinase, partial [Bellilinea sp.]|nr:6-phosphofructokinase [Bellilinea sp.]
MKTIGILTGGGDVPGLNPCIKSVVVNATELGYRVIGIRRGWAGLLNFNLDDPASRGHYIQELTVNDVRTIDRTGGTFLHTSRTNPQRVKDEDIPDFLRGSEWGKHLPHEDRTDYTAHVTRVLEHLGIDVMVPIGGDDTLSFAVRLHKEGFPIVACPKTMDNDVFGTDYCIGFSTAVTR